MTRKIHLIVTGVGSLVVLFASMHLLELSSYTNELHFFIRFIIALIPTLLFRFYFMPRIISARCDECARKLTIDTNILRGQIKYNCANCGENYTVIS